MGMTITKKDLEEARHAIALLAVKEGVSETVIRASIMEVISVGLANQDPAVQARWRSITPNGEKITPERLIAWAAKQIQKSE